MRLIDLKMRWVLFVSLSALYSCEKNEVVELPHNAESEELSVSESTLNYKALYSQHHTMGIDEASELAVDAARLLLDNDEMRSSQPREISNVYIMRKGESGLRLGTSEETLLPDTMAYVFNFADSAGYAVICADDRVGCPVLACVENGSLELGVESDNPGINIFLDNAQVFMKRSILKFEQEKDSLLKVAESEKKQTEPKEGLRKVMKGSYYLVFK